MFLIETNEVFKSENGLTQKTQSINGWKLKSWKFEMEKLTFITTDGALVGTSGSILTQTESNLFDLKPFKMQSALI